MTLRPTDAALHAEFGELLLQMGQSDNGERWLLSAVKLNPGMPAPHRALARHYEERGDAPRAAHHRREAERASLSPKR
jgi:predicted Zn-dependent protease